MSRKSRDSAGIFRVPLACEAVPQIGCGLRAKPVLRALELDPAVRQARLHRRGRLLVVEWAREDADPAAHGRVLSTLRRQGLKVVPLRGAAREKAIKDLAARSSMWYRSVEVDRLSREEARAIAARLVERVRAGVPLAASKAKSLQNTVAAACARELILRPTQSTAARRRRLGRAILGAARPRFDNPVFDALTKAVRLGHRPLPAEH